MENTHYIHCDNEECSNFNFLCDGFSIDGEVVQSYCGVCFRDITHTAVLIGDE